MRNLRLKRQRFVSGVTNYSKLYNFSNQREQIVMSGGTLNSIWNNWNNFWRDYWLAHISGGLYFDKSALTSIHSNYTDKQSCHFLLFLCGKRKRHSGTDFISVHQEATWGDPNIIASLATKLLPHFSHMSHLLGLISHYKLSIEHFQRIRNSFIHLNNENVYKLNSISGYYSFSTNQELIDILESTEITTSTKCFAHLTGHLQGMVLNL